LQTSPSPVAAPTGPLAGLLVLDLSRILAGPTATQLLGDLGADVIKIERYGVGDDTRRWGPPFLIDKAGNETGESAYYMCANRNKRSLALDLKTEEGRDIVRRIAAKADIAIENFKRGGAARMGLDYAALAAINPAIIYASITGYGQTGPLADHAGYDFMAQGRGGIMSITGEADEQGGHPTKVGMAIADVMTGMYASNAILAALLARAATGRGQFIDLALFDSQIAALINQGTSYLMTGETPIRRGNGHPTIVPYTTFPASDGLFIIAIGNDTQFAKFCGAVARPELAQDPRFATNSARVRHRELIEAEVAAITPTRSRAEWIDLLAPLGVPVGPINTVAEAFEEPQALARGARVTHAHPLAGDGKAHTIGNPIKYSETPIDYRLRPPMVGEHSREVLSGLLGMTDAEIDRLAAEGVVDLGQGVPA